MTGFDDYPQGKSADRPLVVLGIETSCDETAAAVVRSDGTVLANVVMSQLDEHRPYGGVVPEIAARSHITHIDGIIREALDRAGVGFEALDAIAATAGPGLIGGVMVGLMTGKAIAAARGLPLVAVNHLEGHALTARLTSIGQDGLAFPYLLLLVSGGHCQLLAVEGVGRFRLYGTTIDDAAGEAFDKVAKMAGLGYPGGPAVEKAATTGDPARFPLPRPMRGRDGCDFSFSGLKTAVRQTLESIESIESMPPGIPQDIADIAASFQAAVGDVLADRTTNAMDRFIAEHPVEQQNRAGLPTLVVAGGVAANKALLGRLGELTQERGFKLVAPPMALCTDNGVMIAWAGIERLALGLVDGLEVAPRARWPLDPDQGGHKIDHKKPDKQAGQISEP